MNIKIKKEFLKTVVGFNNSGAPLGEREDLDQLAIIAHESQNPNLLNLFEGKLPTLAELKKQKTDASLKAISGGSGAKKIPASKPKKLKGIPADPEPLGTEGVASQIVPVDQNQK